jgi:hypothetical protein
VSMGHLDRMDTGVHQWGANNSRAKRKATGKGEESSQLVVSTNSKFVNSTMPCLVSQQEVEAWCWHECLGHLNFPSMKKMAKEELVRGLPGMALIEQLCGACLAGKQR